MMTAKGPRLALVAALMAAVTMHAQQPPAQPQGTGGTQAQPGQGRGRGGGGFRQPDPIDFNEHDGWTSLFDGQTLKGWSGDSNWKVEDGAIAVEASCEKPTGTIYLVVAGWRGRRLRAEARDERHRHDQWRCAVSRLDRSSAAAEPGRGWGPQVAVRRRAAPRPAPAHGRRAGRCRERRGPRRRHAAGPAGASEEQWNMWGAQYDFDAGNRYTGQFYEQSTGRGIVAWKGQVVRTEEGKNPRLLATLGEPAVIDSYYKKDDWNELHIIAVGNQMTHLLNGHVISILIDEDASKAKRSGIIGLEVEATGKLFTRNIWLKKLPQ